MTPEELPKMWADLAGRASGPAGEAAANAMAESMQRITKRLLSAPGRSAPGAPPGLQDGELRRNIRVIYASPGPAPVARVGSFTVYGRIQEYGGDTWPNTHRFLHWVDSLGSTYVRRVHIHEHPYMRPAMRRGQMSGAFTKVAARAVERVMNFEHP